MDGKEKKVVAQKFLTEVILKLILLQHRHIRRPEQKSILAKSKESCEHKIYGVWKTWVGACYVKWIVEQVAKLRSI